MAERERIYPVPASGHKVLSAKQRARIERQTAGVHTEVLPGSARRLLELIAEERLKRSAAHGAFARAALGAVYVGTAQRKGIGRQRSW